MVGRISNWHWEGVGIPVLLCNVSLAMLDPLVAVNMFDTYHLLLLYMTCAVDDLLGFTLFPIIQTAPEKWLQP